MTSLRKQLQYLLMKAAAKLGFQYAGFSRLKIPVDSSTWKYLFKEIFLEEVYYFSSARSQPRIVDCGSNIGFSALYFKFLYPKSKILCFEASKQTFDKLQKTLKRNAINDVRAVQVALANHDDSGVNFYRNSTGDDDLGSALYSMGAGGVETVNTRRLSSYISEEIDYLKLDVEGAETEVFDDLVSSGKLSLINRGSIEFHLNNRNPSNDMGKILRHLTDNGFVYRIRSCSIMGEPWRSTQAIIICFMKDSERKPTFQKAAYGVFPALFSP